jgi:uncharacterized membrane protein
MRAVTHATTHRHDRNLPMTALVLGLVLFLGIHSARVLAEPARQRFIAQRGAGAWKGLYTVVSLLGFALIVWGYGQARQAPVVLWTPPMGLRHVGSLLTLLAFVLLAAAYVPRNGFKAQLHHPMVLAVKAWALAHLLSNGNLADVLLFGGFLLWAAASFSAARKRDRASGTTYPKGTPVGTSATVLVGMAAWAAFAMVGHAWLIGVRPFG